MAEIPLSEKAIGRIAAFQKGVRNGELSGMKPDEQTSGSTPREHARAQLLVYEAGMIGGRRTRYDTALTVASFGPLGEKPVWASKTAAYEES